MTARTPVTVTGVTESAASSPDPFTVGQPSVNNAPASFPVTLNPGATLTVPVTFAPTVPGGSTGALAFATNTTNSTPSCEKTAPSDLSTPPSTEPGPRKLALSFTKLS